MLLTHQQTEFPAHWNVFSGLEENFCITDAPDVFHINEIGSVSPDKEQRIQVLFNRI